MKMTKDKLKVEDEVYCVLNTAIEGIITSKSNYHGMWLYHIKMIKDASNFYKYFHVKVENAVFLHWQLKKLYK